MCREAGSRKGTTATARIARCHLYEQLGGNNATTAPFAPDDNEFRTKSADFAEHLTPELAFALHTHASEFLTAVGINNAPVSWEPPTELLGHHQLPGADPAAVDVATLHQLIRNENRTLGQAAANLGTTLDTVRYLLSKHPAQSFPRQRRDGRTPDSAAYRAACTALSREKFLDLYNKERMSLRAIASRMGVSSEVLSRLAHDYGIPTNQPGHQVKTLIDRDWLYTQYVTNRRTLPEVATECGLSPSNLSLRAKALGIPLRSRGGSSHRDNLAAADTAAMAPAVIRPALAGVGGWDRLRRFADAASYRTLGLAAKELGLSQSTLISQINRVEKELDRKLLERAEHGRAMQLTDDGTCVVTGGPPSETGGAQR